MGYNQIPTGSNHSNNIHMEATIDYCKEVIGGLELYL